jgi:2-oxoisovalerate dehydrogenase E1 component alpha subunit
MANTKVAELGHKALGLTDADVLAMYRQMLLARAVDERMWLMQRAGKIAFIISGQGHEAAQIGITWPMRPNQDWMAPYYRSIASAITFGMTPEDIVTAHLAKGDDVVAITSFGEGTSNQGEVHEAMNFAGVHKLPVIFVCENNGWAISVPLDQQVGGLSVAARAQGYGFPGVTVDGGDPLACYAAAKEAHERARRGEGPTLIEAVVFRLTSHSSDDDQRRYRDSGEVEDLKQHDPIPLFAGRLMAVGLLTAELDEQYRAEVKAEINEASKRAEARPEPDVAAAERWVYAEEGDG